MIARAGAWYVAGQWGPTTWRSGLQRVAGVPSGAIAAASPSHVLLAGPALVLGAGQNAHGALGAGPCTHSQLCIATSTVGAPLAVAAGLHFSLIATPDGLWGCGTNGRGQLGAPGPSRPAWARLATPWRDTARQLAAGLDHALALATDDTGAPCVYATGLHTDGQVGDPRVSRFADAWRALSLPNVRSVAAGGDTSAALTEDGALWMWGNNEYGQALAPGQYDQLVEPTLAAVPRGVCDVHLGGSFVLLRQVLTPDDGKLLSAGYGATGRAPLGMQPLDEVRLPGSPRVARAAAGLQYAAAVTCDGALYVWGVDSPQARLGLGRPRAPVTEPQRVPTPALARDVVCSGACLVVQCDEAA